MKKLITILIVSICSTNLLAQEFALDKGAVIIGGNISFSSLGGDLFEDSDGKFREIANPANNIYGL